MKTILCYGDSITWGYNPETLLRYEYSLTWPGVMENILGKEYRVITEALTGRTTCWDVEDAPYRNGKEFLPMLLESHAPLDLVILMLGINDLNKLTGKTADESAWGMISLVREIMSPVFGGAPPKILIIAPPALSMKLSEFNKLGYGGMQEESKKLAQCQKALAEEAKCGFLDSNQYIKASEVDGVHPLAADYKILGEAAANKVLEMKI